MFACELFIDESLEVEVDSLKMNNQIMRFFVYPCFFRDICLLTTKITLEISYELS